MLILLITFVVTLITYIIGTIIRPHNYPPGPTFLPIIGNLPLIKKLTRQFGAQHLAFVTLANRYKTDVLGLKFGNSYVVIVFGYKLIRQIFTRDEYEARTNNFFTKLRCLGTIRGITCTEGETWMVQRNFVLKHLRELGFGKARMESMINEELMIMIEHLKKNNETVTSMGRFIAPSVLNVLWSLISGTRLSRDNKQLDNLLNLFNRRSKAFDMSGGLLSHFPWLRYVAPDMSGYNILRGINLELKELFMSAVEEHLSNWYPDRDDDLIYSYISEMRKNEHHSSFNYDQLVMVCLDLFVGGSETTSNSLDFAILLMLAHPEIQEKARGHINANLDKTKVLSYADRLKIPYIEALIMEIHRFSAVTPTAGPRRVLTDTMLDKYHLRKGTTILISLHSVYMDPDIWGDPEVFRPERFINEDGKLTYSDKLLTFGLGKRRCLGEILARACMFIFLTGILRNFQIILPDGAEKPSLIPLGGITASPRPYKAILKPCI